MRLKCNGTHSETRFRLSAKRTCPFKSVGASVQSTTGSRDVHISGSNAGYTMFRGSVKGTGYPLHSPVSTSLPLPCVTCVITFQLDSTTRGNRCDIARIEPSFCGHPTRSLLTTPTEIFRLPEDDSRLLQKVSCKHTKYYHLTDCCI